MKIDVSEKEIEAVTYAADQLGDICSGCEVPELIKDLQEKQERLYRLSLKYIKARNRKRR